MTSKETHVSMRVKTVKESLHYITYKFITCPTCQFTSEYGALWCRKNDYT